LAHRVPAERVARKVDGADLLEVAPAKSEVEAALGDAEEGAPAAAPGAGAPSQPAGGTGEALLHVGPLRLRGRTLVEGHQDVGAERLLDGDRPLGGEDVLAPVEVRLEGGALLGDAAVLGQAIDLVAAGVGEDGARPGH